MKWPVYSVVIIILFLFGVNVFFVFRNAKDSVLLLDFVADSISYEKNQAYILPIAELNYIPILNSNVFRPAVDAKSAVVYDTRSARFLFEKNRNLKLPIASLTKIMSAVIVLENLNIEDIVTISEDSIKVDGEKQDLYLGEKMTVRNLLKLMLIESSNDAAYALVAYAKTRGINFIDSMNEKAEALSMAHSYFNDSAGLDDNAYSTTEDLIKLVDYSLDYPEIWNISSEKTAIIESSDERIKHTVQSTNRLLGLIEDIIGGKTGYTEGALQCMILVTSIPGYPSKIVSVVLGSHDRFGDTQKLIDWTKQAYRWE